MEGPSPIRRVPPHRRRRSGRAPVRASIGTAGTRLPRAFAALLPASLLPASLLPGLMLPGFLLCAALPAAAAAPAPLPWQAERPAVPDQVHVLNSRNMSVSVVTGIVQQNGLERVVLDEKGKETRIDSAEVRRIVWGEVPTAFEEGNRLADRGEWEDAVARFRQAAGESEARAVVQAEARLRAAEALLEWGADDAARFREAAQEAERFIQTYPDNRALPEARMLRARALLLSGDATNAAALYRAVYTDAQQRVTGYGRLVGLEAGLAAARAYLHAGDTLAAREVFTALGNDAQAAASELGEAHPDHDALGKYAAEAQAGEGYVLLASDQAAKALTFFESRIDAARREGDAALRFGMALGLGEALLATGKTREGQLEFARVSAIDHSDRDRAARARLRLAEAAQALGGSDASAQARRWLEEITERYGTTPWAAPARELLAKL